MTVLNDTRVLITGATSGLGAAMAAALVDAGGRVMITGRDEARAEAAARALGPRAIACRLDVRDEHSMNEETMIRRGFVPYGPAAQASKRCRG